MSVLWGGESILRLIGSDSLALLQSQMTGLWPENSINTYIPIIVCQHQGYILWNGMALRHEDHVIDLRIPSSMLMVVRRSIESKIFRLKVQLDASNSIPISASIPLPWLDDDDRLMKGYFFTYPETSGLWRPYQSEIFMQKAVDLNHGCFPGYEVIARMYYRNKIQPKHLIRVYKKDSNDEWSLGGHHPQGLIVDQSTHHWAVMPHA